MRASILPFPGFVVMLTALGCRDAPGPDGTGDTSDTTDSGDPSADTADTADTEDTSGDTAETGDTADTADTGDTADTADTGDPPDTGGAGQDGYYTGTLSLGAEVWGSNDQGYTGCSTAVEFTLDAAVTPYLSFTVDCPYSGFLNGTNAVIVSGDRTGVDTLEGTWSSTPFGEGTWTGRFLPADRTGRFERFEAELEGTHLSGSLLFVWEGTLIARRH